MKLTCHRVQNLSYILIDDFFSEPELNEVTQETKELKRFSLDPSKTRTAPGKNGLKKTGRGLFLDTFYTENRSASPILEYSRKFFDPQLTKYAEGFDSFFGFIRQSNFDNTLLNYYTSSQEYRPHRDGSRISTVIFLREGDFKGGDFAFPEQNHIVEAVHNRAVIFPSCVMHAALPVDGEGTRISIVKFINRKDCDS